MMRCALSILLTCFLLTKVHSAKILIINSMPAHSHYTLAYRLAKELSDRNHQVMFINPFPDKPQTENYKSIHVFEAQEFVKEIKKRFFLWKSMGLIDAVREKILLGVGITEWTFKNAQVQQLMNSGQTFDVVIVEHLMNEALVGMGHHFKAPVILLEPVAPTIGTSDFFANPSPTSYIPNLESSYTSHMTFWQRLQNFVDTYSYKIVSDMMYLPHQRRIFKEYFKSDLELDDLVYNISLMLATSHPSVNDPIPLQPNVIEIGGFHVFPPQKLPQHLQEFLDNASEGVVLFCMGSNLNSTDLTPQIKKSILNSFSKIKEKVLWKFETDLPDAPKNVKIMKWLPQQDILGHPNIRAFVTHSGLLSTIEAIYFGVPMVGIPVFGDQNNNIAVAIDHGCAVSVSLNNLTEENFSGALKEVLTNPKYKENAKRRSQLMHDQPLKPIDSAVFWIEYVIRHKGAPTLRSAGLDLKWYQRESIDIVLFLLGIPFAILMITIVLVNKLINGAFCRNNKKMHVHKSKKNK